MNLTRWAVKHGIPMAAVIDLLNEMGAYDTDPETVAGESEQAVQTNIRLEASRKGARIWRNNVGACVDNNGNFIRFGLANDSKKMNATLKSCDLIGIKPVQIKQEHVGHVIGQFLAREVKEGGWRYTGTPREEAQKNFIEMVTALGGDARFACSDNTIK